MGRRIRILQNSAKGFSILPSLLTAAGMFCGYFAILYSLQGVSGEARGFGLAGYAIILAAFLDGLDGRLARLMNAESEFGLQFDSIADVVSFGVAPSVLAYVLVLQPLGRLGWLGAFLFVACAAIRLARFNTLSSDTPASRKYFKGLSSPVAAGGVALLAMFPIDWATEWARYIGLAYVVFLALLMISNIRFRSFKELEGARKRPAGLFMLVVFMILMIFVYQEMTLLVFFLSYLFWGLGEEIVLYRRRKKSDPNVPFLPFGDRDS